jgi:hypothetical protein
MGLNYRLHGKMRQFNRVLKGKPGWNLVESDLYQVVAWFIIH